MKKAIIISSWFSILLGYVGVITVFIWLVYPYKTVTFKSLKVLNSPVKIGENLLMQISYCKYTIEIPTVTSHFVDGIAFDVPEKPVIAKSIGCGTMVISEPIPEHLPPGNYQLQRVYRYSPNPIRSINVILNTDTFEVIK